MQRVTNQMINNNLVYNLHKHGQDMDAMQNMLATGKNVQFPRDNPVAATNQMLYKTALVEIDQYIKNIDESKSKLDEVDSALQSVIRIFQRLRVLAVQGAHGIYTSFERKEAAATEINQMLEELVSIANIRGTTGKPIFGGYQTGTENIPDPFVPIYQTLTAGNQGNAMIGVQYRGNIGKLQREVATGEYLDVNVPGNWAFWATNQILSANKDVSQYRTLATQAFKIDGVSIQLAAGDTIDIIIDKINNAGLSVKASLGARNNLVLETTVPHALWLEDAGSGTFLRDAGMVNPDFPNPPNNVDP
ncbi:MAG TPA: flagellar hook-associated protein FlgL, partial [Spirochaetota bacterium]|nr:flagellar hook-associated protein FlgL [Spirochaetota bacterium]